MRRSVLQWGERATSAIGLHRRKSSHKLWVLAVSAAIGPTVSHGLAFASGLSSECAGIQGYADLFELLSVRYSSCNASADGNFTCLPTRVSDPLVTVASDLVEAYESQAGSGQEILCPEGLLAALAVFARPLVHTAKGQWAAKNVFLMASRECWPTLGFVEGTWPVSYGEILEVVLDAEAWADFGADAEYVRPPREPMPPPFVHELTPSPGSRMPNQGVAAARQSGSPSVDEAPRRKVHILSTGHHASYPSAVYHTWSALVREYDFELEDHSFDTRYCKLAGSCSIDERFAWLGEHLRGTIVQTCGGHYLKGFENIADLAERFTDLLMAGGSQSLASRADLLLCTHPPYSCRLFWPLVLRHEKPLLGFFGGTLEAHVPGVDMYRWLVDFRDMAEHPRVQFATIAPFLTEKIRYQALVEVPVARGFGFHVIAQGVTYFPTRHDEVLIWKQSSECEDNRAVFDHLLARFEEERHGKTHLRFHHLSDVRSAGGSSYANLATYRALLMVPYEVLTMTFYEFYHLGMPMFAPRLELGAFFGYRGPVTYPHCDMTLATNDASQKDKPGQKPRAPYSPFSRDRAHDRLAWLEAYSDWYRFPHLQQFSSLPELIELLHTADLQAISAGMRRETESAMVDAATFWKRAFAKVLP